MFKIAFLFLTVGNIFHETCWTDFFKGHEQSYSLYVHAKHGLSKTSPFKCYEIPTVPTKWGYLMKAQVELLRAALRDPSNKKFIFVSDSAIPIQPFTFCYEHLFSHPYSEFVIRPNFHTSRKFPPLKDEQIYQNSQWIVLNRKHAELMVNDTELLDSMANHCFHDEHYPATFLTLLGLQGEIVQHDCTFVLWPKDRPNKAHPHTFCDLQEDEFTPLLLDEILTQNTLFARKFCEDCDVTLLTDYIASLTSTIR